MWDLIVSVPDHCLSFYFGNITLGISYSSKCLPFWESERVLTTNLEISTNKEVIYI